MIQERICSICHKPGGTAYTMLLKWLGYKGYYAHFTCIRLAQIRHNRAQNARKEKS